MEWSKDMTTCLIELFRDKRLLWDPTVMEFKDRIKKHDSWFEIGAAMKLDGNEVEKKMRKLIGQFQRELKRENNREGEDTPYKSKWNFFKMLLFLKDKNETRQRHSTAIVQTEHKLPIENEIDFSHASSNQDIDPLQDSNNSHLIMNDVPSFSEVEVYPQMRITTGNSQPKSVDNSIYIKCTKRKADVMPEEDDTVMKQLSSSNVKKRDAFDVFGEHVASTLRNIKSRTIQIHTKFEINNTLYRAEINDETQN